MTVETRVLRLLIFCMTWDGLSGLWRLNVTPGCVVFSVHSASVNITQRIIKYMKFWANSGLPTLTKFTSLFGWNKKTRTPLRFLTITLVWPSNFNCTREIYFIFKINSKHQTIHSEVMHECTRQTETSSTQQHHNKNLQCVTSEHNYEFFTSSIIEHFNLQNFRIVKQFSHQNPSELTFDYYFFSFCLQQREKLFFSLRRKIPLVTNVSDHLLQKQFIPTKYRSKKK